MTSAYSVKQSCILRKVQIYVKNVTQIMDFTCSIIQIVLNATVPVERVMIPLMKTNVFRASQA